MTISRKRQRGAIAVMFTVVLVVILGFFFLAIDMSRVYNRRAELHALADVAALAAAGHLNGTKEGIEAASSAAKAAVEDSLTGPKYLFVNPVTWSDGALAFGATRAGGGGGWKSPADALLSPAGLMYVKVDTSELDAAYGHVKMFFGPVLSASLSSMDVRHVTIAGKSRLHVTPLAVCAMSADAHAKRANPSGATFDELIEYGFRRGVSYDLMRLNSHGTAPMNFQVDPIQLAGGAGAHFTPSIYAPYICSGTMATPAVTDARVRVQSLFPLADYYTQLNSRFDPYTGSCNVYTAPPDSNVRPYPYASISWMSPKPTAQSAKPDASSGTKLQTIADLGPPNHPGAVDYGPLWSFARAVPWASFQAQGTPEPGTGYLPFDATSTVWKALYGTNSGVSNYATSTPYQSNSATFYLPPGTLARKPGVTLRRVLNIPLLACPVTGSEATVLAIGKFLMTVPATSTTLHAEFGGITTDDRVGGLAEIYQ